MERSAVPATKARPTPIVPSSGDKGLKKDAIGSLLLGYLFFKALIDYSDPANSYTGESWFGIAPPAVIGVSFLAIGVVLLFVWCRYKREPFFLRRREIAPAGLLESLPSDWEAPDRRIRDGGDDEKRYPER